MKIRHLILLLLITQAVTAHGQTESNNTQRGNSKLAQFLHHKDFTWKSEESAHFIYYYEPGVYLVHQMDSIKAEMEGRRLEVLQFLDSTAYQHRNAVFLLDTRDKVKQLLGFAAAGFAMAEHDLVVFMTYDSCRLFARHELCHQYAYQVWGRPAEGWMSEGLAVYFDEKWSGFDLDALAKHFKDNRQLVKLPKLLKDLYQLPSMIAYPELGSFIRYLIVTYGKEKFRQLWKGGLNEAKQLYGIKLAQLGEAWQHELDKVDISGLNFTTYDKFLATVISR